MEPNYPPADHLNTGVEIDHISRDHLKTISTWARIVAIVAMINIAVSFIGIFLNPQTNGLGLAFAIPVMLIYAAVIVLLNVFLLRFANQTSASLETQNQVQFNSGINNLKTYWKFVGILLIIAMSFVLLAIMAGMLGALVSTSR